MRCISSDEEGAVYISGPFYLDDTTGLIGVTSKLTPSGNLAWEHTIDFDGTDLISPLKGGWISPDLLLIAGSAVSDLDSNFYEYFLATYDQNGFVKGGISDITGRRNRPASIARDGAYFYIAGKADPEIAVSDPSWQFLCKYSLDAVVSASVPPGPGTPPGPLVLYPNPVYDHIKVSLQHTGATTQGILEVNDFQGVIMLRKEVSLTSGTNDFVLEIPSSLLAGVYETSLRTTGKVYGARFVKMK